jgi:acid phosphatase
VRPNEILEITTGSAYADPLYVDYSGICPELKAVWTNFTNSEEFSVRKSQAERVYAELFVKLNKTMDDTNWLFVGDWLASAFCGEQAMANVTDEVFQQAIDDWAFYNWGPFNRTRGVGGAAILRQLFEGIDKSLSGESSEKLFLFVGNHRTLVALLNTIGVQREDLLPFESHLGVEIWGIGGTQKVRFILNGDPIGLDLFDGESLVDYGELKRRLEPFLGYCTVFD